MAENKITGRFTRRDFLLMAGAAAGALTVPSRLLALDDIAASAAALPAMPAMRIGLLLPRSGMYPCLTDSLRSGFTAGVAHKGKRPQGLELLTEDIGSGGLSAIPKAEKLARGDKADLVIAFVSGRVAESLDLALGLDEVPVVVANVGEHMTGGVRREGTFHNTLHYWQAQWAIGRWAAEHLGRKAFISASIYEGGYDGLYAFRLGLESAGGKVIETDLCIHAGGPGPYRETVRKIAFCKPDFVYALHSGSGAAGFMEAFSSSGLSARLPLAGTPFLADGCTANEGNGHSPQGISTCFSWLAGLKNPWNAEFTETLPGTTGRRPDAFSLLGYDTALMIRKAMADAGGSTFRRQTFIEALRNVKYDGPRGTTTMQAESGLAAPPLYLAEARPGGKTVTKQISGPSPEDHDLKRAAGTIVSGWHNAYMCIG